LTCDGKSLGQNIFERGITLALVAGSNEKRGDEMILAEKYRARSSSAFDAYMALQRALLNRWMAQGGTEESWCLRLAPVFRTRYAELVES
jgi:hypothetical protein